jgi:hypothetical protein
MREIYAICWHKQITFDGTALSVLLHILAK